MTPEELKVFFVKHDVDYFSTFVFDRPYSSVAKIIYPKPRYKYFTIKKKSGGDRVIAAPRSYLKELQHALLAHIETLIDPPKSCVHGFVRGRSIVTNASVHATRRTKFVLNIDLADFFPSISFLRVKGLFQSRPFHFSHPVATVCAQICCANGTLVQGAPTSPIISNLICRSLDNALRSLAAHHGALYTRYCDDITFSFRTPVAQKLPAEICKYDGEVLELGRRLIEEITSAGFLVNDKKSRISGRNRRMEVTGLTINAFPNVKRSYVDSIRGALHSWDKFGYGAASAHWEVKPYSRQRRSGRPTLARNIYGRLLYLAMVRGQDDHLYIKLAEQYNRLAGLEKDGPAPMRALPIARVMKRIEDARRVAYVVESRSHYDEAGPDKVIQGSCFLVGEDLLLTCYHVVHHVAADTRWFLIEPETDAEFELTLQAEHVKMDVAVLKFVAGRPKGMIPLALSKSVVSTGAIVTLLGFPFQSKGRPVAVIPAHVASYYSRAKVFRMDLTSAIRQGNSGGPLVNSFFELVGMATEGASVDGGNNECLCVSEIQNWLAGEGLI